MRNALLSLLALLVAGGCGSPAPARVAAPADSARGELPFELAGPSGAAIIVPVTINGQGPFDFVLDTGATVTCIDQALADSLGLPPVRGAIGMGAGVGGAGRMRLVRLDSLRVGQARAYDLPGCALDLGHVQDLGIGMRGLLGLNFLKPFRVTLDFQRSVLILQEP